MPLGKIFCEYKNKKQILKEKNDSYQYIGYLVLWFLKKTLDKQQFPKGEISNKIWTRVIKQFVLWIFVSENLDVK